MRILFYSVLALLLPIAVFSHGVTNSDKVQMISGGYLDYIYLGAKHMVTGYDHLLFIFGVIFFLTKFREIVKFITAFTIGHSITLIFATFYEITASHYLIDAVIALSVCYKGFENIDGFKKVFGIKPPNLLFAVFAFGLIHGFGLSTRLQQLPLGDESSLIWKILSFNAGVEIGQIMALSVILLLLNQWRKKASFQKFSLVSNKTLIALGIVLFVFQIGGYVANGRAVTAPPVAEVTAVEQNMQKPSSEKTPEAPKKSTSHSHKSGKAHSH